ncbi:MAG: hypothetical protein JNM93_14105 [Bacteriovoracaceae bacterium]|nr:hypothetical protein [Bacteriovoracaceae bacterium]
MLIFLKYLSYFLFELHAQEIPREIAALGEKFIPNQKFEMGMKNTCQYQELENDQSKVKWVIEGKFIPGIGTVTRTKLASNEKDAALRKDVLMNAIAIENQSDREAYLAQACSGLSFEEKVRLGRGLFAMLSPVYDSSKILSSSQTLGDNKVTIQSQYLALKDYYINKNPNARSAVCRHAAIAVSDLLSICGIQSKSEVYVTAGNSDDIVDINDFIPKDYRPSDYQILGFATQEAYIQNYYQTHGFQNEAEFKASYKKVYEDYRDEVNKRSPDAFSSMHQAVTVQDPNSSAKYSINWSDLDKVESNFAGLATYLSSDGIRNTGLGNFIYSPEGEFKGYIRNDLGNLVGRAFDDQQAMMNTSPYDYLEFSAKADRRYADYKIKQVVANTEKNHFNSTSFLISDDSNSNEKSYERYRVGLLYFNRTEAPTEDYGQLKQNGGVIYFDGDYIRSFPITKKTNQLALNLGLGMTTELSYIHSKTEIDDDGGISGSNLLRPSATLQYKNESKGISARVTGLLNSHVFIDTHPLTDKKRLVAGTQNSVISAEINKKTSHAESVGLQFRSIRNIDQINNQYLLHYLFENTKWDVGISHFKILEAQKDMLLFLQVGHDMRVLRIPTSASLQIQRDPKQTKTYIGGSLQMTLNSGPTKRR